MVILLHYDEITLKGANRPFFERILTANIKEMLKGESVGKLRKEGGRIVIDLLENSNKEKIFRILKRIPGISNFSFAETAKIDMDIISRKVVESIKGSGLDKKGKTFKVATKRSNKNFNLKSPEINSLIGEYILNNTLLKVDIHSPDFEVGLILGEKSAYIYTEKTASVGGLPVGSSGKAVCLLSGGIDSPVAAYMMAKRGMKVVLLHFKNATARGAGEGIDKIKELARIISSYQGKTLLYIMPFNDFQKEIVMNIPSKNRMIVYRRLMLRMAEKVAKKEGAQATIVGDSIGQVASQTIENLSAAYSGLSMPVLAPLIGFNKNETVIVAKSIGTYETSIIPYPDCCSLIAAKHPEIKANRSEIEAQEKNIDFEKIAESCFEGLQPESIE